MQPVIKQLESIFPYGSYQVLEAMLIRSREGRNALTKGMMKNFPVADSSPNDYTVSYVNSALSPEGAEG